MKKYRFRHNSAMDAYLSLETAVVENHSRATQTERQEISTGVQTDSVIADIDFLFGTLSSREKV